jgi:hypothetical protein
MTVVTVEMAEGQGRRQPKDLVARDRCSHRRGNSSVGLQDQGGMFRTGVGGSVILRLGGMRTVDIWMQRYGYHGCCSLMTDGGHVYHGQGERKVRLGPGTMTTTSGQRSPRGMSLRLMGSPDWDP